MAKTRRCKQCKQKNEKFIIIGLNAFCDNDYECASAFGRKKSVVDKVKSDKKKQVARKKTLTDNDKPLRLREAQKSFNAFIRKRDELLPCISCERVTSNDDSFKIGGAWDCGHFLTRGAFPELRFEELNAHKQCKTCNGGSNKYARKTHLVATDYRINLIEKIGPDKVEWLEGPHKAKKYTCSDLKAIELKYKEKLKLISYQ
jgi:hypothetical protein